MNDRQPTPLEMILGLLLIAAGVGFAVQSVRLASAKDGRRVAALRADSAIAAADTSRRLMLAAKDSAKLLGDSLVGQTRRVVQVAQTSDALDRAIGQQRRSLDSLVVQVAKLSVRLSSTGNVRTDTVTGARSATFDVQPDTTRKDQPPYRGTANVLLPVSGPGSLALTLALPPADLALRVNCGPAINGIRSASATITGPAWLPVKLGSLSQDAETCNPQPLSDNRPAWRRLLSRCGATAGYNVVASGGRAYVGPSIGGDCKFFP